MENIKDEKNMFYYNIVKGLREIGLIWFISLINYWYGWFNKKKVY